MVRSVRLFSGITLLVAVCIVLFAGTATAATNAHEMYVIDAGVVDAVILEQAIPRDAELVRLRPGEDGMRQIAAVLEGRHDLKALHLISHGSPGKLHLGEMSLLAGDLLQYEAELTTIRQAFGKNGEILLYGCNVAEGKDGKDFVQTLSALTGTKIAASIDRTGPESLGGNGALEFSTGPITSRVLAGFDRYPHILAAITYDFASNAQGWTGDLFFHNGFPSGTTQLLAGSSANTVNSYPPAARYLQTLSIRHYQTTGESFRLNVYYGSNLMATANVAVSTSWSTVTINKNFDRLEFVKTSSVANGWFYPAIDNVATTDVAGNNAPTVTGSASVSINTTQTATPFSTLTVADANGDNVSLAITYPAANGTLSGTGLGGSAGNYTMSLASAATIQSQLRSLVFTPTAGQVPLGSSVTTTFSITPSDPFTSGTANTGCQVSAAATYPKVKINNPTDNLYAYISNVSIGSINNTSTYAAPDNQPAYQDFSALSTNMPRASTQSIAVTLAGSDVTGQTIAAFVDWNNNGVFTDPGEIIPIVSMAGGVTTGGGPYTTLFTVPVGATLGAIRMRVVTDYYQDPLTSCVIEYGEAEDYTIIITEQLFADLSLTVTDGSATAIPGSPVTYTISVSNAGPQAVTGATVADTFPAALTGVNWTANFSGGSSGTTSGNGNINQLINLAVGGSATYTVSGTINPAATGTLTNTCTITPPAGTTDPTPANNSATDVDTLTPTANLAITVTDGVTAVTPGGSVTYTITVNNAGPSAATGATVVDTFPAALTGVTWTANFSGGSSGTTSGSGNINQLINLAVSGSATYTVSGTINPAATGSIANTVTVTPPGGTTDPNSANNSATDTDTVITTATLTVTINGPGTVTSQNQSGTNFACNSGTCSPVTFGYNDSVTLNATGSNSTFSAWSGDLTGSANPGSITMAGDKAVTATFTPDPAKVLIDGNVSPYYSIGAALDACSQDGAVRAQATPLFIENIVMNVAHALKLRGGFTDAGFTDAGQTGYSTVSGSLKIKAGKLVAERLKVKP